MSAKREFTTAELTQAILRTVAKESERERRELGVDHNPVCCDAECARKRIEELERENAALRADKERLEDWLEKHRCFPGDYPEYDVGVFISEKYGWLSVTKAIDAARAKEGAAP